MADLIQLLPDTIANQIAAGEVIQRPASAVKELLENAIDAGASRIQLILKEAGKSLIQVIDDGQGMSETDARMCFERHATSKIRSADDLFALRTMGFRGEALASIASIAQVELRTRRASDDFGTKILIEGFQLLSQEPCTTAEGTNFQIRNLFYNVPARRNFLKSNPVEMRHILDEFERCALANPHIFFSLHHNESELFHLPSGNLRQRIVSIFGKEANKKLVPVTEETDIVRIEGFIGKPEFAKKTRGEQFFFVNNRFIKSGYLHHAISVAFEELLPKDSFPFYVLFIDIDPRRIDVNVHPTKQEIKFDDEKLVYNYLRVAVRHALGQHSIAPTLDFEQEISLNTLLGTIPNHTENDTFETITTIHSKVGSSGNGQPPTEKVSYRQQNNLQNWQSLYEDLETEKIEDATTETASFTSQANESGSMFKKTHKEPYQIHNTYIVSPIKSGFLLIDQQAAHERVLYERFLNQLDQNQVSNTQKELFPRNINLSPSDAVLLREILPEINSLGVDIRNFGGDSFVIQGLPSEYPTGSNEQKIVEELLELYKQDFDLRLDIKERVALTMAKSAAIKRGTTLTGEQMQHLIDQLFACLMPFKSPNGKSCFLTFDMEELSKQF